MLGISAEMSSIIAYKIEAFQRSCLNFTPHTSQIVSNLLSI